MTNAMEQNNNSCMNKALFILCVFCAAAGFTLAQNKTEAELRAECVEKDMKYLKDLGEPKLDYAQSASIIMLGDTQTYTPKMQNQGILDLMTSWIAVNAKTLNIKAVVGVGDIVEHNGTLDYFHHSANQNRTQMWKCVSRCFERLDNRLPCILSTGNHDYGSYWAWHEDAKGTSFFSKYFDPARNYLTQEALATVYRENKGYAIDRLENALYKIDMGGNWGTLYFLVLEYYPRPEILDWARKLLAEKYAKERVVLVTHQMIHYNNKIARGAMDTWEKLVAISPNIKMVLCGHSCEDISDFEKSVGFLTAKNSSGGDVQIMMFNPQCIGGGFAGNGGDGWLRILEFTPDGKTINVKTYSPLFGISPLTKRFAWRTAEFDMFSFPLQ